MHWSSGLIAAIGLIGAVVGIGTVFGVSLRTSGRMAALNNYRELAESYKMKFEEGEQLQAQQAHQIQELQAEVGALRGKVETLTDLLTNRVALQELATSVHHIGGQMDTLILGVGRIETTLAGGTG